MTVEEHNVSCPYNEKPGLYRFAPSQQAAAAILHHELALVPGRWTERSERFFATLRMTKWGSGREG
jgi:hypothetical protein